jgi:hypothetical protein
VLSVVDTNKQCRCLPAFAVDQSRFQAYADCGGQAGRAGKRSKLNIED